MDRPSKLASFLALNSAEFVDQLAPSIRPILSNFFRICRHHPQLPPKFDPHSPNRDLAISLLALLANEDPPPSTLLMAFLSALLHSGHFDLFCKFLGLHLVDALRFEQFAKTHDDHPFFLPSNCQLPQEENDLSKSTSIDFGHRREFVERHGELLRMKLKGAGELAEMMTKWGIPLEGNEAPKTECQMLIDILVDPNGPPHSFELFCLGLLCSRQFRIFSIFYELANLEWMNECWGHFVENGQNEGEEEEEMEEEEGIGEAEIGQIVGQIRVENVDSLAPAEGGNYFDMMAHYRENRNEIYKNFSSPRGLALVVNNFHFPNRAKRDGSQLDVLKMTKLLEQLDYRVDLKKDLTAQEILWAMVEFAAHPEHHRMDSAIVVLMSHGEHRVIMGIDDEKVDVEDDLLRLLNQNAPGLRGKPKIFIVQACRGNEMDMGIQRPLRVGESVDGGGNGNGTTSFWPSWLWPSKNKKNKAERMNLSVGGLFRANPAPPSPKQGSSHNQQFARKASIQSVNEPTDSDVLIAYPTTPYYVSWRNSSSGSWFVQSLCDIFSQWAKSEDILSMMTRVNALVAKRETMCPKRYKQTPEQINRLRKKFYFFPGVRNFQGE